MRMNTEGLNNLALTLTDAGSKVKEKEKED